MQLPGSLQRRESAVLTRVCQTYSDTFHVVFATALKMQSAPIIGTWSELLASKRKEFAGYRASPVIL